MRRIVRCACAALLAMLSLGLSLGLAACEDEPEPNIPSASPTPTESSPSPSPTPEPESAEAFIERWAELETEMQNTGETEEYRSVTSNCEACTGTADAVDRIYAAGGFIETDGRTVLHTRELPSIEGFSAYEVQMESAPTEYKASADGPVKTFPGGRSTYEVELKGGQGNWQVWHYIEVPS